MRLRGLNLWLAAAGLTTLANAQPVAEPAVDKSGFNLFNPTPPELLRELTTDGPGATESPYTVDAGHFQLEMALVRYTSDQDTFDGLKQRFEAWSIAPGLLKIGVLNSLDAELLLEPYNLVYERAGTNRVSRRGFGDTTLRLKYNVWGNDSGRTAFALVPFVTFPTSQQGLGTDAVEGGIIVPFEAALPGNFYLGLTTRFDLLRDLEAEDYHAEFINSLALYHDLFWKVAGYAEFFSAVSTEREADWVGTVDTGLIYRVTEDVQLNAGVNIGVTRPAEDWNLFVGVAWRY